MEADGVTTVKLGNEEFEGRNNAYVLDRDGVALVDPGSNRGTVREQLEEGLAGLGYGFEDVEDVLITHFHTDHAGLAAAIQDAGGATVHVHEGDAPLVRGDGDAIGAMGTRQSELFEEWGVPEEKVDAIPMMDEDDPGPMLPAPESVTTVSDGDVLSVGGFDLEVVHSPGHAAGHACFEFETDRGREAFVGDAVLPVYTPNVGGSDGRVEDPLATYLDTLRRLRDREYAVVWPGHRTVIEDPAARIDEIIDHHRERGERIVSFLREQGPADTWTVSDHLFGELDGIHIVHGPGEAHAHLDYLQTEGVLERTPEGYRVVADAGATLEDLPV